MAGGIVAGRSQDFAPVRARLVVLVALLVLAAPAAGAPPVAANAVFIQNGTTGEVLYRDNDRDSVAVASITKLMTALVTLQHTRLDDVVVAQPEAASVGESTIDLQAGERLDRARAARSLTDPGAPTTRRGRSPSTWEAVTRTASSR